VLCQRHADSMVVPRGWTLDDLRDPDLHLFRPPAASGKERPPVPKSRPTTSSETEQLAFSVESGDELVGDAHVVAAESESELAEGSGPPEPWTPTFDEDDDLGGLLTATSPLLARAFRGSERKSPS